ncbi:MAG: DUF4890 domain-containing protein [Bacteroidaceae bacterium]|nr:DUF4890 domain-containing protein [Bacteroidaceae bacterium]
MKRLLTLMVIALSCATMTQAQDCNNCQKHKGAPTDLAQKKTDDMVAQYDLNAEQAAKLLALNKEYAAKLSPRAPRHHHHGAAPAHQCKKGEAHQCKQGKPAAMKCDKCKEGGKCDKCAANQCTDCDPVNGKHCTKCKQGKPAAQPMKCDKCKEGGKCDKCAANQCTDCDPVNGKHCTKCKEGQAHQCKQGQAHQCKKGEAHQCKQGKPEGKDCGKQGEAHQCKQGKPHGHHHKAQANPEQMKQYQAEYDAQLKKIMTAKQYKAYKKAQEK